MIITSIMESNFTWKEVSEKEKEGIKKEAKGIMDSFSKKLSRISGGLKEPLIERESGEREEKEGKKENDGDFREIMFENAPEKRGDFVLSEKKSW